MSWNGWEHYVPQVAQAAKPKRSKYNAQPTTVDNIRFDSAKEAKRYGELKLLEQAGEISRLLCQPSFNLTVIDMSEVGKLRRAAAKLRAKSALEATPPIKIGRYVADFAYWTKDDKYVVEDVKGVRTPVYRLKKKIVEAQYGIEIREV